MPAYQPGNPEARVRRMRGNFFGLLIIWGIGILVAIGIGANDLLNNYFYHATSTQLITATVTRTARECDRVACGYSSYGTYTFQGQTYTNIKLRDMLANPVTGQVTILVNHHKPKLAMDPYLNPYVRYATVAFGTAAFGGAFIAFAYVMWQRAKRRLDR